MKNLLDEILNLEFVVPEKKSKHANSCQCQQCMFATQQIKARMNNHQFIDKKEINIVDVFGNTEYGSNDFNFKTGERKIINSEWEYLNSPNKGSILEEFHSPLYTVDTEKQAISTSKDLILFYPNLSIIKNLLNRNITIQRIENGSGDLYLDYFSVEISQFPKLNGKRFNPQEFLNYVRVNLNYFVDTDNSEFYPFTQEDNIIWKSTNPEGAVVEIDIFGPYNGAVVVGKYTQNFWIFSTLDVPEGPGNHPINGNRQFGIDYVNGKYRIFTRGADTVNSLILNALRPAVTLGQKNLWESFQDKILTFINNYGGIAKAYAPVIKNIPLLKALDSL